MARLPRLAFLAAGLMKVTQPGEGRDPARAWRLPVSRCALSRDIRGQGHSCRLVITSGLPDPRKPPLLLVIVVLAIIASFTAVAAKRKLWHAAV